MKLPKNWSTVDKLNHIERRVLIHSYLYYEMNENIISDDEYNKMSRLLAKKVQQYKDTKLKKTMYGYVFKDFEGSTGFDLLYKLTKEDRDYIIELAVLTLDHYQRHVEGKMQKVKKLSNNRCSKSESRPKQTLSNMRDTLDGNLNRMMVTDDLEELDDQFAYAKRAIVRLYKEKKAQLEERNGD